MPKIAKILLVRKLFVIVIWPGIRPPPEVGGGFNLNRLVYNFQNVYSLELKFLFIYFFVQCKILRKVFFSFSKFSIGYETKNDDI